jgi:glycosyltransferase involved in cell wall biosynthesis
MASRVAIFTSEFPPYPGGIATYTAEIANAAYRLGLEPVVFAPVSAATERIPTEYEVVYCWTPSYYRHYHLVRSYLDAARLLRQRGYDFVVAANLDYVVPLALLRTSAKKIAVIHGTDAQSRMTACINAFTPFRPYNAFNWIAANSTFSKKLLLKHSPSVAESRVVVASLGVSDYWHAPLLAQDRDRLTARFSISPDRLLLLSVGRIERRKGVAQAIAAISQLPTHIRRRVTYVIVGRTVDHAYAGELTAQIEASGADIRRTGAIARDELRALYHRAHLLVHTATADNSSVEGFGLVFLEAAACGLPSLATRVDAIPEVVVDNVTGFLVDDRDIEAIANRITEFQQNRATFQHMSANCRARSKTFTWERCARITFGLPVGDSEELSASARPAIGHD